MVSHLYQGSLPPLAVSDFCSEVVSGSRVNKWKVREKRQPRAMIPSAVPCGQGVKRNRRERGSGKEGRRWRRNWEKELGENNKGGRKRGRKRKRKRKRKKGVRV